jgi:hypothetical protein
MSAQALFTVVLPVFGLIGLGYTVIALRLVGEEVANGLADFTFVVALPILLFRALGTLELPDFSPIPLWISYFSGALLMGAIGIIATEKVFGRDARAGVIGGLSTSYANLVMVGIPVLSQAFGEEGLVLGLILVAVHLPVMMTLSAFLIEFAEHRDGGTSGRPRLGEALLRTGRSLLKNALVIAILAGLAYRATGLPLEGVPREIIDRVSETAIPLALVALGMSLKKYGVRGNVPPALALGVLKLFVMPGLVFLTARYVVGLPPLAVAAVTIGAACPTGVNAYLIATRFQTGLALSANTITLTTAASVVTLTFWVSLFK